MQKLVVFFNIFFTLSLITGNAKCAGLIPSIALEIPYAEEGALSGHILSYKDGDYRLTVGEFDGAMIGVLVDEPVASIEDPDLSDEQSFLLSSEGEVYVRVSGAGGPIKKGDFITSSDEPGVGKKADRSGFVLGVALEDFDANTADQKSEVLTHIDIKSAYIESGVTTDLLYFLRSGGKSPFLSPLTSLRYLLAALIVVGSFVIAFAAFGRTSGKGIEALGRNPLAKSAIRLTIIMNFALTFIIMVVGLVLAYLILSI